ncbi:flagellar protein FlaF [Rhizobiales bacterium GAS191]|jgi:flagellar protein FlaF|nr:flagellar protein FlaF [Rhizobiales bacterium GAS113]SEC18096.1 flagellar protein FlaF [Rhizobiales bacterium GAS191]SED03601.1 flagellar protein FlaF [Rhizobiales bacterium GAS188]
MYQFSYAEIVEDTAQDCRDRERRAFERAISLLKLGKEKGVRSREAAEALLFLRRLWGALMDDLVSPENGLPQALRASLISIGLWVMKEADQIRLEQSENFDGLIEINQILRDGLN